MPIPVVKFQPDHKDHQVFWKIYEEESHFHESNMPRGSKFESWGDASHRVCRFCKKDSSSTTFKQDAHLIPEMMGNKHLFSNYECDVCNSSFSKFESEFSSFSGIWHTMSQVTGKKNKVPTHMDNRNNFHVISKNNQVIFRLTPPPSAEKSDWLENYESVTVDREKGTFSVKTFKPSFIPREALKCLVKIGLSMLKPENMSNYEDARKWLLGEILDSEIPMHPYFYILRNWNSRNFKHPLAMLLRKRTLPPSFPVPVPVPEHTLLLFYGRFIYQVFLPFNTNDQWLFSNSEISLPIEYHLVVKELPSDNPLGAAEINCMNMGSTRKQKNAEDTFTFPVTETK